MEAEAAFGFLPKKKSIGTRVAGKEHRAMRWQLSESGKVVLATIPLFFSNSNQPIFITFDAQEKWKVVCGSQQTLKAVACMHHMRVWHQEHTRAILSRLQESERKCMNPL